MFRITKKEIGKIRNDGSIIRDNIWASDGVFMIKKHLEHEITKTMPTYSAGAPDMDKVAKIADGLKNEIFLTDELKIRGVPRDSFIILKLSGNGVSRYVNPYLLSMLCDVYDYREAITFHTGDNDKLIAVKHNGEIYAVIMPYEIRE